jgi:hypothetical protein
VSFGTAIFGPLSHLSEVDNLVAPGVLVDELEQNRTAHRSLLVAQALLPWEE